MPRLLRTKMTTASSSRDNDVVVILVLNKSIEHDNVVVILVLNNVVHKNNVFGRTLSFGISSGDVRQRANQIRPK